MKSIGKTLKEILRMKNVTQAEFAKIMNFSPSYISCICSNDDMTCKRLGEICLVLDINPAVFFNDTPIGRYTAEEITSTAVIAPDESRTDEIDAKLLQGVIAEKDKTIHLLQQQIEILQGAIKALTRAKTADDK